MNSIEIFQRWKNTYELRKTLLEGVEEISKNAEAMSTLYEGRMDELKALIMEIGVNLDKGAALQNKLVNMYLEVLESELS